MNAVHEPRPRGTKGPAIALAVLKSLGVILVVGLAALVLGAFFPQLPGVGVLGSALSGLSTWISVTLALAFAATVWLLFRRRTLWRGVVAVVVAVSLVGSLTITGELLRTGLENDAAVNPFSGVPATRAPDVVTPYGERDGSPLEVSIWRPDASAIDAPVAFFTHGGGWVQGAPTDDVGGMIPKLTAAGWLVVSAGYTLATPELHTVDFVESQIGCAMAWTARNAVAYGGDPSTFVSFGDSAGGNLAINTSYRSNAGDLSCDAVGPMPTVAGTATLFPGVDPYALYEDQVTGGSRPGRTFMQQYIGGSPEEFPERYAAVDSSSHISADAPPTLILQGANDHLVQAHGPREFAAEAEAAGLDVTFVTVPFGEHVFQATPLGAEIYTRITLRWLDAQREPTQMPWGERVSQFRDPDGTLVNLGAETPSP